VLKVKLTIHFPTGANATAIASSLDGRFIDGCPGKRLKSFGGLREGKAAVGVIVARTEGGFDVFFGCLGMTGLAKDLWSNVEIREEKSDLPFLMISNCWIDLIFSSSSLRLQS
jgi:hypothetical protein